MNISIIVPSCNRFDYINSLIDDIYHQSIQVKEIIIIDQSDQPYDLDGYDGVVHIVDHERGPCHARNLGLENSSGEILVFLDDDIRITPDFLQQLCMPIIHGDQWVVVGAICNAHGHYPNQEKAAWKKDYRDWFLALTANPGFKGQCVTISFSTGCSAINRSVYEKIGGFDTFFDPNGAGEDREYGLRIFKAGFPIFYNGQAFVRHLGAPSGGRRGSWMGFKYQNILQANSVYIIAKHFGWPVFNEYCASWLRSILNKGKSLNPRLWVRSFLWWFEAREYISHIKKLKSDSDW